MLSPIITFGQQTFVENIEEDGFIMEKREFTTKDTILIKSTHYIYDSYGTLSMAIIYDYEPCGVVETRTLESYKKGNLLIREVYTVDDDILFYELFSYDKHNNIIKRKQICYENGTPETHIEKRKYSYDNLGNIIKAQYFIDNILYYSK